MGKKTRVERPLRRTDYEIVHLTAQARAGWRDLRASIPGPLVDTWEFLTETPTDADRRRREAVLSAPWRHGNGELPGKRVCPLAVRADRPGGCEDLVHRRGACTGDARSGAHPGGSHPPSERDEVAARPAARWRQVCIDWLVRQCCSIPSTRT